MLEVAKQHAIAYGWRHARVQQIAADAGVSRPTLYKEFPSKTALGIALFHHEVSKFLEELHDAMAAADGTIRDTLRVGCLHALDEADRGPFLAAVLTEDRGSDDSLLPSLTAGGDASIVPLATTAVRDILLARAHTAIDRATLEFIANVAVRLTVSQLVEPSAEPRSVVATRVADMCAAYAGE